MNSLLLLLSIVVVIIIASATVSASIPIGYVKIFEDNFDAATLDTSVWSYEEGFLRNNELQYYRNSSENVRIEHFNGDPNGLLIIEARNNTPVVNPANGQHSSITSGSIFTKRNFSLSGGSSAFIIETSAKVPSCFAGLWPCFWMLGIDDPAHFGMPSGWTWPWFGEVDIIENVGYECDFLYSTAHDEQRNGWRNNLGAGTADNVPSWMNTVWSNRTKVEGFSLWQNTYQLHWDTSGMKFYVNGKYFYTVANPGTCRMSDWPFTDCSFQLKLNLAIGGTWGGVHGVDPRLFAEMNKMEVDYVRVYEKKAAAPSTYACVRNNYLISFQVDRSFDFMARSVLDSPFLSDLLQAMSKNVQQLLSFYKISAVVDGNFVAPVFPASSPSDVAADNSTLLFNVSIVNVILNPVTTLLQMESALQKIIASATIFSNSSFADLLLHQHRIKCTESSLRMWRETAADRERVSRQGLPFASVVAPTDPSLATTFLALDYDFGGASLGNLDSTVWNEVVTNNQWGTMRRSTFDGVDATETTIAYIVSGEWLRYSRIVAPAAPNKESLPPVKPNPVTKTEMLLQANRTIRLYVNYALNTQMPTWIKLQLSSAATGAVLCAPPMALPVTFGWNTYFTVEAAICEGIVGDVNESVFVLHVFFDGPLNMASLSVKVSQVSLVYVPTNQPIPTSRSEASSTPSPSSDSGTSTPATSSPGNDKNGGDGGDVIGAPTNTQVVLLIVAGAVVVAIVSGLVLYLVRKRSKKNTTFAVKMDAFVDKGYTNYASATVL